MGRIYRTTSPIDAASLPESYIFNSGATAFTRSERFYYDGTRRIQEVVTDPVIVHEEGDIPTINGQMLLPPEGLEAFTRLKTQYVWGPGDSPTSGALELLRVTEITKNASGATVEYPRLRASRSFQSSSLTSRRAVKPASYAACARGQPRQRQGRTAA
ncbi:MAG: hypothetical protein ACK58T_38310 [Phycisphaerae bacterium]